MKKNNNIKDTVIQARVEKSLRDEVKPILYELGISLSESINIFLHQVKINKGLPFPVKLNYQETEKVVKINRKNTENRE
jgi:DNA-damage-inducible protein J